MEGNKSKSSSGYLAELDLWRCLFCILIVFSHGIFLADTTAGDKLVFGMALIGVCIGSELFFINECLQAIHWKKWISFLFGVFEILCYAFVFYVAHHNTPSRTNYVDRNLDFCCVLALAIAIGITVSGKSFLARYCSQPLCRWLAKWGTCLYLTHWNVMRLLQHFLPAHLPYYVKLQYLFAISFFVAFCVMYISHFGLILWIKYRHMILNAIIDEAEI